MRYLQPIQWCYVAAGAVVVCPDGVPRTVIANTQASPGYRMVLVEGLSDPHYVRDHALAPLVELDTADAIGNLFAAGLNPTPIDPIGDPS